MEIAYLLADTALSGGIRVIAAQADALCQRGHRVTLITPADPLTWRQSRARWQYVQSWSDVDGGRFDFIIGTFWTTVPVAYALAPDRAIHLSQGYEGSFSGYAEVKKEIDAAYALPIPKITVSRPLVEICRQFSSDVTYIGQVVDDDFFQPRASHSGMPRVLLPGQSQGDMKGIDLGYAAVQHARDRGAMFDLIRVSPWHPEVGEPTFLAQEFHTAIDTEAMARLLASCDVFLGPNRHQEGFGLPAAEALASGVPAVLTSIPSYLSWDPRPDYALFSPENDFSAIGDALLRLLSSSELREQLAARGRVVAEQFRSANVGEQLDRYFTTRL